MKFSWKKIVIRTLVIIFVAYVILVIARIPAAAERAKTKKAVEAIHAQKLTLDTVLGKNLPPVPDPKLVDATIEGIDVNNNGIRDDVELAIFKKYPDSPKIRAAELQYAMALQMELTKVFNSETLVAVTQEEGRGFSCLYKYKKIDEIENLIFNNKERKDWREKNLGKYMTSYSLPNGQQCDIDPSSL